MKDEKGSAPPLSAARLGRRDLLRLVMGGAAAFASGQLLAGCGSDSGREPVVESSRLFVSTFLGGTVERYDFPTFQNTGRVATGISAAQAAPGPGTAGMATGPDGGLWVANRFQDSAELYDPATLQLRRRLQNLNAPHSLAVGTNNVLYVPNVPSYYNTAGAPPAFSGDRIESFDATTGDYLGEFAEMSVPFCLKWGPDNRLYASSAVELALTQPASDSIRRFNAEGSQSQAFITGAKIPFDMLFTPDGNVLVSEFLNNRVQLYSGTTGQFIRTFIANVPGPIGLAYGPDGALYVGSNTNPLGPLFPTPQPTVGSVRRYNAMTGAFQNTVIDGLFYAAFLVFA